MNEGDTDRDGPHFKRHAQGPGRRSEFREIKKDETNFDKGENQSDLIVFARLYGRLPPERRRARR